MTWDGESTSANTIRVWDGNQLVEVPLPEGLPAGAVANDAVVYLEGSQPFEFPRRVMTTTGTDLWIGGDSHILGTGNYTYNALISSTDGGASWVVINNPAGGGPYGVGYLLHDSVTGRMWAYGHLANTFGSPITAVASEVTSLSPWVSGGAVPISDASFTNPPANHITSAVAPGNGKLYLSANFSTSGYMLTSYDATTVNVAESEVIFPVGNSPAHEMAVDLDFTKYGDGEGRLYFQSQSVGYGRVSLGLPGVIEHTYQYPSEPSLGGSGWTGQTAGIAVDGANNAIYMVSRSNNNGHFHILKSTLEPFLGATSYYMQFPAPSDTSTYPVSLAFDPATSKVAVAFEIQSLIGPGGWAEGHVVVFTDTGSAFTLDGDITIPDEYRGISWRSAVNPAFDPEMTTINGKFYLPMNGGDNQSGGSLTGINVVLEIDPLTLAVNNITTVSGTKWTSLSTGDLEWSDGGLNVNRTLLNTGDLAFDGDNLNVAKLAGDTLVGDNGSYPAGVGTMLRKDNFASTGYTNAFPQHVYNYSSGSSSSHNLNRVFDGMNFNRTNGTTNAVVVTINSRSDLSSTLYSSYKLQFTDTYGQRGHTERKPVRLQPSGGQQIYGAVGVVNQNLPYIDMNSAYESVELTYSPERSAWTVTNRWRPWEYVTAFSGATFLNGGKLWVYASGDGTEITMPGTALNRAQHGDEVQFIFNPNGLASQTVRIHDGYHNFFNEQNPPLFDKQQDEYLMKGVSSAHFVFIRLDDDEDANTGHWHLASWDPSVAYDSGHARRHSGTGDSARALSNVNLGRAQPFTPAGHVRGGYNTSEPTTPTCVKKCGRFVVYADNDGNGNLYVVDAGGGMLRDDENSQVSFQYAATYAFLFNADPRMMAWDEQFLWTLNYTDRSLSKFSLGFDGSIVLVDTYALDQTRAWHTVYASGTGYLAVFGDGGIAKVISGNGSITYAPTVSVGTQLFWGAAHWKDDIWLYVTRLTSSGQRGFQPVLMGGFSPEKKAGDANYPGTSSIDPGDPDIWDIAFDGKNFWIPATDSNVAWKCDPVTKANTPVDLFQPMGRGAYYDGQFMWFLDSVNAIAIDPVEERSVKHLGEFPETNTQPGAVEMLGVGEFIDLQGFWASEWKTGLFPGGVYGHNGIVKQGQIRIENPTNGTINLQEGKYGGYREFFIDGTALDNTNFVITRGGDPIIVHNRMVYPTDGSVEVTLDLTAGSGGHGEDKIFYPGSYMLSGVATSDTGDMDILVMAISGVIIDPQIHVANFSIPNLGPIESLHKVDCSGGAITVTLPVQADCKTGQTVIIKDFSGDSLTNNITILPGAGTSVNGGPGVVLATDDGAIRLTFQNNIWMTV